GGHRFDPFHIDFRQLLDESQNRVEFIAEMLNLFLGHGDAGEMGDAADGVSVDRHGISGRALILRQPYSRAPFSRTTMPPRAGDFARLARVRLPIQPPESRD